MHKILLITQTPQTSKEQKKNLSDFLDSSYPESSVEEIPGLSFSPRSLLSLRKKLQTRHDVTILVVEPFLCYFKQLFLYLLLLGVPSAKKYILVTDKETPQPVTFLTGLYLVLLFPFAVLLHVLGLIIVSLYFALLKLTFRGKPLNIRQQPGDNRSVLFIIPFHRMQKAGGAISHVRGTIGGFKKQGWKVLCAALADPEIEVDKLFIISPALLNFFSAPLSFFIFDLYFSWKIIQIIKHEKPAFIYQRQVPSTLASLLATLVTGTPHVLEVNAITEREEREWFSRNDALVKKQKIHFKLLNFYEKIALRNAHRLRTVSNVVKKHLIEEGVPEKRITTIPNGVDPEAFHPDCGGKEVRKNLGLQEKIVVGFSGTFAPYHGVDTLTEIITRTAPNEPRLMFLLIGDGLLRSDMETQLRCRGINADQALFTGQLPHREVPAYLDACDILCSPTKQVSKDVEFHGSPTKIFEYMAMEKPIISSNVGQLAEIFENEKDAFLVAYDDIDGYCRGLQALASQPEIRTTMGRQARKRAVEQYSWDRLVKRIITLALGNRQNS